METGVVLSGGGARAAYQVGVLRAISDMYPDWSHPFRVIVGTSAGAINAMALAGGGSIFRHNVSRLEGLWGELAAGQIYKSNTLDLFRNMTGVARRLIAGSEHSAPIALLDNSPLRKLLGREVDFGLIRRAIDEGELKAVGVNACSYSTGQNVCFYEGPEDLGGWLTGQRCGVRTELGLDHVMASSAIPTVFPPVRIGQEFYGDGITRQMAHISPALRLGAGKVLVIGVSANGQCPVKPPPRHDTPEAPNFAHVIAHVFNGMFLDTLDYDIDRLRLINQLLGLIPRARLERAGLDLQPVELLEISPSQPLDEIAARYMDGIPLVLRNLVGSAEHGHPSTASLASYLLFDSRFCKALIRLGYEDAQAHAGQIDRFFGVDTR
ncbi:patatin-like phospholipase family protein [Marinobacter sp.]|uniref:patatin-like phospholipase family protein n=1 Tax=Marinobacter sp. TaxID=50741 RepID=UPI0019BB478D|nr:patatin-like phospholipase family protein [Marinobacter sp.]MBD3657041.1 patatin-like phospholipase family protein [Marinobacter sp.]